jgi:cell division ATPase FtsA
MPVRVAPPKGVTGLIDEISTPAYATSVGLLLHALKSSTTISAGGLSLPRGKNVTDLAKKVFGWVRGLIH